MKVMLLLLHHESFFKVVILASLPFSMIRYQFLVSIEELTSKDINDWV